MSSRIPGREMGTQQFDRRIKCLLWFGYIEGKNMYLTFADDDICLERE